MLDGLSDSPMFLHPSGSNRHEPLAASGATWIICVTSLLPISRLPFFARSQAPPTRVPFCFLPQTGFLCMAIS